MFKEIEAVFFDLDGTLVDSMWMWRQIDVEYLGKYGYELPDGLQKQIEGMSFSETAVYFKTRFNIPDSIETIKNDWNQMAWYKYENEVSLKKGAYEFLCFLKENNIKTGIATSNSRELAELVLEKRGVKELFDVIVTCCDVKNGKPSPDVYLKCASMTGADTKKCLVLEDIPKGLIAGNKAGMKTVAVFDEFSVDMKNEKEKLSDAYIENYKELLDMWKEELK